MKNVPVSAHVNEEQLAPFFFLLFFFTDEKNKSILYRSPTPYFLFHSQVVGGVQVSAEHCSECELHGEISHPRTCSYPGGVWSSAQDCQR